MYTYIRVAAITRTPSDTAVIVSAHLRRLWVHCMAGFTFYYNSKKTSWERPTSTPYAACDLAPSCAQGRSGAVQCRGAPPGRPGAHSRGGTRAPCRRGWPCARPRGMQRPPLELSATTPVQANHLETGGVVRSSVEVLRQGDRATEAAHGPRVGACGPAPGHGAAPRHSSSVPQPPVQPNRLEAGSVVRSSVKVLRQGDRAPEAEAAHRHRVGAGGYAPGNGGCSTRPLELSATAPVQANHFEVGDVALSSVEVLRQGDRAPDAEAARGPRVGAGGRAPRHGGAAPATRAERHNPCASQPPRDWRCGAVQCRGAPPGRPGAEAAHGLGLGVKVFLTLNPLTQRAPSAASAASAERAPSAASAASAERSERTERRAQRGQRAPSAASAASAERSERSERRAQRAQRALSAASAASTERSERSERRAQRAQRAPSAASAATAASAASAASAERSERSERQAQRAPR